MSLIEDAELRLLAIADWQEQLAGLSDQQIADGLKALKTDWPPSAHDFRRLCEGKQEKEHWQHNTAAYRLKSGVQMLEKKADKDKARSALSKARQMMQSTDPREKARIEADAKKLLFGGEQ